MVISSAIVFGTSRIDTFVILLLYIITLKKINPFKADMYFFNPSTAGAAYIRVFVFY